MYDIGGVSDPQSYHMNPDLDPAKNLNAFWVWIQSANQMRIHVDPDPGSRPRYAKVLVILSVDISTF
jgi:hypothetical protein